MPNDWFPRTGGAHPIITICIPKGSRPSGRSRGVRVIGQTVSHYTIVGRLGHGGMGVVYKAVDNRLQRTVALKFLPPGLADSEESRERLFREARMASTLEHQNICAIHEVDETPDGQVFICMSFYEGRTLSQLEEDGPLPVAEALRIALQMAEGLAYAHSQGVIHRDIKPANIMLTASGVTKVMDFGLARQEGQERLTRTGTTVGTLAYMAPEQVTGESVDARSDVWSVGVLLFEMLTGRLPFTGDYEAAIAYSIVHEAPRSVKKFNPGVPDVLDDVIRRCLSRRPADRYASATDLLAALRQVWQMLSPPGDGPPRRIPPPAGRIWTRPRIGIPLAAILILVAAGWLAVPVFQKAFRKAPPPPPLPSPGKVAVLPFRSASPDIASCCLAEGFRLFVTERLALAEGDPPGLWVISAEGVRSEGIRTPEEARRQENVNLVVTGEFSLGAMAGASLRIFIQDPRKGTVLREAEFKDSLSSLSTFQGGWVDEVMRMLGHEPGPGALSRLGTGDTALPGAFRQYIQGLGALELQGRGGGVDMALILFRGAVANDPSYADAWAGIARGCLSKAAAETGAKNRWLEEAASAARQALEISPQASSHRILGRILEAAGKTEDACSEYQLALQNFPGCYDAECDLAWAFLSRNRMKESEQHFLAASRLRPDYWLTYNYLGFLYNSLARYPEAEKMFMEAIRLAPDNVSPYGNLIAVYYKSGRNDKIREMVDRVIPPQSNAVLLSNLGTICFQIGMYLDAAGFYERAIAAGSKDYEYVIWGNLAECHRQLSNQEKAREAFEQAIRLGRTKLEKRPQDAEVRSRLALYYAMSGRGDEARREIQAARKRAPADVDVLVRAVRVYELTGQRDAAIEGVRELINRSDALKTLEGDPDMANLRNDPRYKRLAAQLSTSGAEPPGS